MRRSTAPLREREFRLLFAGRTISLVGSAIAPVALAFAVLDLTGSKTDLGLILAAREIPLIVFLLVGGIWADRLPRNRVMVGANVCQRRSRRRSAAALLITGNAEVWHLAALAAVNGGASAFFFPASAGVIPQTVPAPLLQQANALLALALNSAMIGGAALARLPRRGVRLRLGDRDRRRHLPARRGLRRADAAARGRAEREPAASSPSSPSAGASSGRGTWLWVIVLQFSFLLMVSIGALSVLGPVVADEELGGAEGVGRDPDRPGGRPRRRRADRPALPAAADAARRDARDPAAPGCR